MTPKTKKSEVENIPQRWGASPNHGNALWQIVILDGGNYETGLIAENLNESDANFIVENHNRLEATNAELVEACTWLIDYMEDEMDKDSTMKGVAYAKAAISKAEGGK